MRERYGPYREVGVKGSVAGDWKSATIASGATTSGEIDLGKDAKVVELLIEDCSPIPGTTTMSFQVARASGGTFVTLWHENLSGSVVSGTLPTSGGIAFWISAGAGFRYWKVVLSNAVTSDLTIYMRAVP